MFFKSNQRPQLKVIIYHKKDYIWKIKFRDMIVIDVETTGTNPDIHSIVSVGVLDFFNSGNNFYQECRIWKGAEIQQAALDVNGFTRKEITDPRKKSLKSLVTDFLQWAEDIEDKTLAGHNVSFDISFLISSAERYNVEWSLGCRPIDPPCRTLDLHSVAYAHYLRKGIQIPLKDGRSALSANKIFEYVGLPREPVPHNGLVGAKMEAEALSRIIYGKSLLKEFEKYKIPDYLK